MFGFALEIKMARIGREKYSSHSYDIDQSTPALITAASVPLISAKPIVPKLSHLNELLNNS